MVIAASRCRVLIVEDDADTRDVMTRLLRRAFEVDAAESVGDALMVLEQIAPALPSHILLDLMLPDMSGVALLEHVRRRQLPVRVALLTAAGPTSAVFADAMQLNPDAVFHKPALFADIEAWLNT